MLEVFGLVMLCKANKKNAIARGKRPGGFIALTIILWIGLEILGVVVGVSLDLGRGSIFLAYLFAGIGALISFLCAKFGPKGDYVDPSTQPVNSYNPMPGAYNVPVDTASYTPYPNGTGAQPSPFKPAPSGDVAQPSPFKPAPSAAAAQPRFCEHCGSPLPDGSNFCGNCGAKNEA